ncbi:LacI family DNA-binding transcriptional regulator [Cellulomonas humilata]|uniref:LacI family transcriptional regulator n=1 Tax=Cellulomonas humilata TaxID=144055 RepID=A0ABU0EE43_9CELL|nr:LacI family DNA-binding transcriptional regulator [Cellulomonas humilata]MDQ0373388.1 LacI family transcriptional regulator [Cellulomonas humilata]
MTPEAVKRATIEDVARRAGVSRAAVSKVIRGAYGVSASMRERVEAVIEELDYRPLISARGMRGATFTLGMELPDIANQFFARILSGATTALETEPYQLVIAPVDPDHSEGYRALEALADRQVDGLIAVSPRVDPRWLEEMSRRIPIVMLGRHDSSVGYDTVVGDDVSGVGMLMQHLLELGHREIAHLTLDDQHTRQGSGTPHSLRLAAYEATMREAGLESSIQVARCDGGEDSAHQATLRLLASGARPTAIFAAHDELAIGVLSALTQRPDASEISVAGYDNIKQAGHPLIGLTSVDQPGEQMGASVVSLLLERLAGRTDAVHEVATPRLVPRSSTRPRIRTKGVTRS